jgi:hypothetical protein
MRTVLSVMKIQRSILGLLLIILCAAVSLSAADPRKDFDAKLNHVVAKLNREAAIDAEGPMFLAEMVRREYGTREEEIKWAINHSVSWGEIAALAYIQATTGRSFEAMTVTEDARRDFWSYAEKAEMSPNRMAHSLESFLKRAEKERNSRIFERLRASRRVQPMPDLGSGFGLFQEALDFRRIDSPRPTKIHNVPSGLAKGGQ